MRNRTDHLEFAHQSPQYPRRATRWGFTARNGNQRRFTSSVELTGFEPCSSSALEHSVQALLGVQAFGAPDRVGDNAQLLDDFRIVFMLADCVCSEQDLSASNLEVGGAGSAGEGGELLAFLGAEGDLAFLHGEDYFAQLM